MEKKDYIGNGCYLQMKSTGKIVNSNEEVVLDLTAIEYTILRCFLDNEGVSISINEFASRLCRDNYDVNKNLAGIEEQIKKVQDSLDLIKQGFGSCIKINNGYIDGGCTNYIFTRGTDYPEKKETNKQLEDNYISSDKNEYFELLWKNHYKGILRDQEETGNDRELIDFFVIPTIIAANKEIIETPFSDRNHYKYLCAGSGFGKSTLFDMILLSNIARPLLESPTTPISDNSKKKISKYETIRKSMFGEESSFLFPVFVHSEKANDTPYKSILDLAERENIVNFLQLVENAHRTGQLLFLIDSIDEVESDKQNDYLKSIKQLLADYPQAQAVFASRFFGKKHFPVSYESIYLSSLTLDSIKEITYAMLTETEADKFIGKIESNNYLRSLADNPFMLMIMIETKSERLVHRVLGSIINAIIDRRWDKQKYNITTEGIKLLIGYLACTFVFDKRTSADNSEIRQAFTAANKELSLFDGNLSVPNQNIESFAKTLSSQSGILNVLSEHHVERYVFQDNLVMCWLAANYINRSVQQADEIIERKGESGIWSNVMWFYKFISAFSQKGISLSKEAILSLILTLVMNSEKSGPDLQNSILYFMIFKYSTSIDKEERSIILQGFQDIVADTLGDNDITTNHTNSVSYCLITQINNQ